MEVDISAMGYQHTGHLAEREEMRGRVGGGNEGKRGREGREVKRGMRGRGGGGRR